MTVPVAVHEAGLGTRFDIPTFDGPVRLRVPPGTQTGQRFRLRERGVPSRRDGRRGDLVVEIRIVLPSVLDERSKALLREFGAHATRKTCARPGGATRPARRGGRKDTAAWRPGRAPAAPGKAYYMISAVAQKYNIHPQTLRLYEREGLLKPSRTDGNTRLYSDDDLQRLETILSLTRDLGVNLAGVEIILNMRQKMDDMQHEVNEFMEYVKRELARGLGDWEQRLEHRARARRHPPTSSGRRRRRAGRRARRLPGGAAPRRGASR